MATDRKLELPMTGYGEMVKFIVRSSSLPRAEQDELLDSWFADYKQSFYERSSE